MKSNIFEIGQFGKDIEKARKIADKEYQKRLKVRGRNTNLYKVNTTSKLDDLIQRIMVHHPKTKITPKTFKRLITSLDSRRLIDPEIARQLKKLNPTQIASKLSNLRKSASP